MCFKVCSELTIVVMIEKVHQEDNNHVTDKADKATVKEGKKNCQQSCSDATGAK